MPPLRPPPPAESLAMDLGDYITINHNYVLKILKITVNHNLFLILRYKNDVFGHLYRIIAMGFLRKSSKVRCRFMANWPNKTHRHCYNMKCVAKFE